MPRENTESVLGCLPQFGGDIHHQVDSVVVMIRQSDGFECSWFQFVVAVVVMVVTTRTVIMIAGSSDNLRVEVRTEVVVGGLVDVEMMDDC